MESIHSDIHITQCMVDVKCGQIRSVNGCNVARWVLAEKDWDQPLIYRPYMLNKWTEF